MEEIRKPTISEEYCTQIPKREHLVEWVCQWGGSIAEAVLDPKVNFFSTPEITGVIGYRLSHGCAVVLGEPICSPGDIVILTKAFHQFMDKQDMRVIYLIVSHDFAQWAIGNVCGSLMEFGQELTLNPMSDPRKMTGKHAWVLRNKVKQAARQGVTVHEYRHSDAKLEQSIDEVGKTWLKARRGHQFHIGTLFLFKDRIGKRWFYAKRQDTIVGTVILNQYKGNKGWFLTHLMEIPGAPHGTSELLVVSALETLANEGCTFVTLGTATNPWPGEIIGLNKFSAGIVRLAFKLATKLGHLYGLNVYWSKFNPYREPAYILFSRNSIGIKELLAIKNVSYDGNRG